MIISASRRTDIPAFHSSWFFNRVEEGFLKVRNPYNKNQVRSIEIIPEKVDCIIFWSKDPLNIISNLKLLDDYNFYFLFTLNAYPKTIERNLRAEDSLIRTFCELSNIIGSERVIWRYDPIIINSEFDKAYHNKNFKKISRQLSGYTKKCIISFLDLYKKTEKNLKDIEIHKAGDSQKTDILQELNDLALKSHISLEACSEELDFSAIGIKKTKCIDIDLINKISGKKLPYKKDSNQRKNCNCNISVDIGAYNTCKHNCIYCYANYNWGTVQRSEKRFDERSAFIID